MSELSPAARIEAARELLLGWSSDEYAALSAESKAALQEAIEHLHVFDDTLEECGRKK